MECDTLGKFFACEGFSAFGSEACICISDRVMRCGRKPLHFQCEENFTVTPEIEGGDDESSVKFAGVVLKHFMVGVRSDEAFKDSGFGCIGRLGCKLHSGVGTFAFENIFVITGGDV